MEYIAHDLLQLKEEAKLISYTPIPDWVEHSLGKAPFVVVRRAVQRDSLIPVGVRGERRNQRFGAFVSEQAVKQRIRPEDLVSIFQNGHFRNMPATGALKEVAIILKDFAWGPTGSVGFEFASGAEVVTTTSDLDILIRLSSYLSVEQAQLIVNQLKECPVSVDVQVETEKGAFSLVEYARGEKTLLLRTVYGPSLIKLNQLV
ncbi:malonate decarboxylase holo-ACP synthase [Priestia megaterium]|uniref:Malonate decarboxylase holo-ACP synthase n=1 Tax=Priestia megaterium TaxID=1404 RepID=A0A6M6DWC3_PRIMG|nr:malonate decarboxylase holo-ACP synthase [Priestia megaterium]AYE52719.1 malonate decarboxylase holo-ACP synthase [Priestia megaterium NCT-2]MCJ7991949.1 malonate decarboxylase holo-ACP synthase [Priestia sp. OVS21]QJX79042.1 malonate decarboxylase holo-ACP synthase [Priestia megaterium]